MWKNIVLASYTVLTVSSVTGVIFGGLGWPDPIHVMLIWVSGLLFVIASVLHFKLVQIHKTDTRIHELEEANKDLRTARKVDKEEFKKMEQKFQLLINTRFNGLDVSPEKDIVDYVEAVDVPASNFLETTKTKLLSLIKK